MKQDKTWFPWHALEQFFSGADAGDFWSALRAVVDRRLADPPHGDFQRWRMAVERVREGLANGSEEEVRSGLRALHPWRKGPWQIGPVSVDAEWRSDWKWSRFLGAGVDLTNKLVLDVGSGNGYYLGRMLEAGARAAIGVDPVWLHIMQALAAWSTEPVAPRLVLPLALEEMPESNGLFDVVFSWGVLSHRRSPFDHLARLRRHVAPGGYLVLETLVLRDAPGEVLVPEERYAQMRNVWFIPDAHELSKWLRRARFAEIALVDLSTTTTDEQRSTEWMEFQSLCDGLRPGNPALTVEGYPRPVRAMYVSRRPVS